MNSSPWPRSFARRRRRTRACSRAATALTAAVVSGCGAFLLALALEVLPIPESDPMPGGPTA
ncbi:hypothetical protein I553_10018 [Mycobacterium xenopi 4042]|uniref:Uncharacterized protein n=1 Tax=Mycobacterium xenopi 4042 TaxID=1299334 RepID=X7YQ89_MYCXE|nr:hypothetical protein I553_10018 [Mycobacterium xenopi 4042]